MSAEHHDDGALALGSCRDGANHGAKITRDKYIRERFQERREAAVLAGRRCELGGRNLVGPPFDGNRADF
jgi:hypothetical protein